MSYEKMNVNMESRHIFTQYQLTKCYKTLVDTNKHSELYQRHLQFYLSIKTEAK